MSTEYASPARTETSLTVYSYLGNDNERSLDCARDDRAFQQSQSFHTFAIRR